MAEVVHLRPPVALTGPDPYRELQRRRTELISAWTAWLATAPNDDAVAQEIQGTTGAMQGLADLVRDGRTPRT